MTATSTGRRRRADAGVVAVSERDAAMLGWVGDQFTLRDDLVGVVLGRLAPDRQPPGPLSRRTARGWADRMQRGGYLTRHRMDGRTWLVATVRGLRMAGLPYDAWQPDLWQLDHRHAVALVRLAVEAAHPGARWESERAIRSRWHGSGASVRYADGGLTFPPSDERVGVEVELHRKAPARYRAILRDQDPAWAEVWWFTPAADVGWLLRTLAESGPLCPQQVHPLPGEVAR
jgi:hypothetical protein